MMAKTFMFYLFLYLIQANTCQTCTPFGTRRSFNTMVIVIMIFAVNSFILYFKLARAQLVPWYQTLCSINSPDKQQKCDYTQLKIMPCICTPMPWCFFCDLMFWWYFGFELKQYSSLLVWRTVPTLFSVLMSPMH